MVSLRNVTRTFRLSERALITPVRDVSLEINPGEFIIITGRSGSGKTTLLNLAAGIIRPTSGEVLIGGARLDRMKDREISFLRSRLIGFVFQFPSLLPSLTVLENTVIPGSFNNTGKKQLFERALALLDTLRLADRAEAYPKQLSAGEQKRAAIARALVNQPRLLLADEPTSDLDAVTESAVMGLLKDTNSRGAALLMVTHNLELLPCASRGFRMEEGALSPL